MKILVTGAAGFIGSYVVQRLLERGDEVVGLDNINDYYEVELKYGRLAECGIVKEEVGWYKLVQSRKWPAYRFIRMNLEDSQAMEMLFVNERFGRVCHLAAQAGVRYSITNPRAYIESNIDGFFNVLECCRWNRVEHLVFASSSSVYGLNGKVPFSEKDSIAHPVSLYAASKKSNELMAHAYSHLYGIPVTGLRFFTVYGPWGRPDMSPFLFADAILHDRPVKVFNQGGCNPLYRPGGRTRSGLECGVSRSGLLFGTLPDLQYRQFGAGTADGFYRGGGGGLRKGSCERISAYAAGRCVSDECRYFGFTA